MTPAAAPARIGQGTAVEQSRAVAEVQAAIVVAQQVPRDINAAIAEMRQSCQQPSLAARAFFRYSRGQGHITGAPVHLARQLARCRSAARPVGKAGVSTCRSRWSPQSKEKTT